MTRAIVKKNLSDYQLISTGIELVHTVFALYDCVEELAKNQHMLKAKDCAVKWNELFFDAFITQQKDAKE